MPESTSHLTSPSKPCGLTLSKYIAVVVTDLVNVALTMMSLHQNKSDRREWWNRVWSRKEDAGMPSEAQEEEQLNR